MPLLLPSSQAVLRKLSREDKERANRIVNQCSSQFIHDYSSLCQFHLKLIWSAEEFFAKMSSLTSSSSSSSSSRDDWMEDVNNPFVLVVKKTT
jgi:hypothetical protein